MRSAEINFPLQIYSAGEKILRLTGRSRRFKQRKELVPDYKKQNTEHVRASIGTNVGHLKHFIPPVTNVFAV